MLLSAGGVENVLRDSLAARHAARRFAIDDFADDGDDRDRAALLRRRIGGDQFSSGIALYSHGLLSSAAPLISGDTRVLNAMRLPSLSMEASHRAMPSTGRCPAAFTGARSVGDIGVDLGGRARLF